MRCFASSLSYVWLFVTPWIVVRSWSGSLSTGFSRQEYWSGLPCPPPEDLPNPEIKLRSPELQVDSLPSEPPGNCQIQKTKTIYWTVFQQLPSGIQSKDLHNKSCKAIHIVVSLGQCFFSPYYSFCFLHYPHPLQWHSIIKNIKSLGLMPQIKTTFE